MTPRLAENADPLVDSPQETAMQQLTGAQEGAVGNSAPSGPVMMKKSEHAEV